MPPTGGELHLPKVLVDDFPTPTAQRAALLCNFGCTQHFCSGSAQAWSR